MMDRGCEALSLVRLKFVGTSTVDYGDHDAVPLIGAKVYKWRLY